MSTFCFVLLQYIFHHILLRFIKSNVAILWYPFYFIASKNRSITALFQQLPRRLNFEGFDISRAFVCIEGLCNGSICLSEILRF